LPDAVDAPAKLRLLHGEKRDREEAGGAKNNLQESKTKSKKKKRKKYTRKQAMVGKKQQGKRQMRSADILQASGRTSVSERLQKQKTKK
jgi:hypothetical protein